MKQDAFSFQKLFPTPFLMSILAISVFTNLTFAARLHYPDLGRDIRLWLLPAPEVLPSDHMRGNPDAEFTVIEYSDYQCPFSASFHASMRTLLTETDVRWIYRHFPLDEIHPLAAQAAEAAECAGEQGRFWEYSDALFERQSEMSDELFSEIAQMLELRPSEFQRCLSSRKFRPVVSAHRQDGTEKAMNGTPTFYINGKRFEGLQLTDEGLKRMLGQPMRP